MSRIRRLLPSAVAILALTGTVSCQVTGVEAAAAEDSGTPPQASTFSQAEPAAAQSSPSAAPSPMGTDETVNTALDALPGGSGSYTIAVEDLDGRDSVVYGADAGDYDTASIVKVDILAALLLRAQDRGTSLTAQQKRLASAMIRSSDNAATDALWQTIGGAQGLDAANERLGLTATVAGKAGRWGLTQTTATDQLLLLEAVFGDKYPLTPASRAYVQSLMSDVVAGQRWGISAAAGAGSTVALKNGWLPRTATGLWDVNSIGRIHYKGHSLLVAVLSDGQSSQGAGINLVEQVATTAVKALVNRA
ncbi:serine hydrolase [Streptomyces sp. ISL-1]|uniref:serine hydrolase n=1 Tax=Streptomyces sp. ISL-1 TaxID=2817657 RepID=UPI001BEC9106|nr:serine hydrolase [Streptomyces sp. ISL-1]MBT2392046.1 serine hydrolase [Streptomyces sp. ISL-1]